MTQKKLHKLFPLLCLALGSAALLSACPTARVTVTVGPTTPPPLVHPPPADCQRTHYYKLGRYRWERGKYVFYRGRCTPRPTTWHRGCRWRQGKWVKRGRIYKFTTGGLHCGKRVIARYPTAPPPPPKARKLLCNPRQYVQRGAWQWVNGKWRWRQGQCVVRTRNWRARRCGYRPGTWRKVRGRNVFTQGRVVCALAKIPAYPTRLPPKARRTRARCGRGRLVVYPGGYRWDPVLRRYLWQKGKCISIPRRFLSCRFTGSTWHLHKNGRARLTPAGWRCPGKSLIPYSRIQPRRCTAAMRKAGRCGRTVKLPKKCKRNFYLFRGKCVRRGVRRCTKAMRKAGRCR